ncbi:ATP-binding protein [Pedobacter steynii]
MRFSRFLQPEISQFTFKGESFIRIGSYKKSLNDHPERERAIWNKQDNYVFEKAIAMEYVNEDEVLKLIDYTGYFELIDFRLPDNRKGIIDRLLQDKIIFKNGAYYDITNLGALLFAKDMEKFETLSRRAVRVVFYDGSNRIKTIREQVGKKGYAVGFEGLIKYFSDNLPSNEIIDAALRRQVTVYPILALRELIANSIIHQDFSITGSSPMIEVFNNRIEITNPGKPLIDPLRFVDHSPESRNEILAKFMRRLNICEERGSGIDKVVFECEFNQLPAHEVIVGDNYTRIIMYGPKKLRQMDKADKVRACYLHACLKYVSGDIMTNQSLRERFGIEERNYSIASRIISDGIASELIKDYDADNKSKKYAKYVPYWV